MKKRIACLLVLSILAAPCAYAAVGDEAGFIYTTDIVADIDGMAVPSYNIGGKTVVIAEELEPYGFEVVWDAENRLLNVYTKAMPDSAPYFVPEKSAEPGKIAGTIYESDIVAYVNGMWVESYNIGGRTALVMEDMASTDDEGKRMSRDGNPHRAAGFSIACMQAVWDAGARTISLTCLRPQAETATHYGSFTIGGERLQAGGYSTGAYRLEDEDGGLIEPWVNVLSIGETAYIPLRVYLDIAAGAVEKTEGEQLNLSVPDEGMQNVLYDHCSTTGSCYNVLLTLEERLCINGRVSQAAQPDFCLYGQEVYVSLDAVNSALNTDVFAYKYELPAACTTEVDNVVESHVVVYINDMPINSFNVKDGTCYIAAADLEKFGFGVIAEGQAVHITTPEAPVVFELDSEYPETYWYGEIDTRYTLYPVYNGIYDVTVDGKEIDDVYVWCQLSNKTPCISAVDMALLAGYRLDTSDPMKVKIYTQG